MTDVGTDHRRLTSHCPMCGRSYRDDPDPPRLGPDPPPAPRRRPGPRWRWIGGVLAVSLAAAGLYFHRRAPMLDERFDGPDGLVTNEYAHWNPRDGAAVRSPTWDVTSGSLFAQRGTGWSGRPDRVGPDVGSRGSTNSAVFRLVSHEDRFGDVRVALDLDIDEFSPAPPINDWDGVHIFLRYQNPHELYYASIARRDGTVVAKKKTLTGGDGGEEGSYHTLASVPGHPVPPGWHRFEARIRTTERPAGVGIEVTVDGRRVLQAQDRGMGGPPIAAPGRVGIRADNTEFHVDNIVVAGI